MFYTSFLTSKEAADQFLPTQIQKILYSSVNQTGGWGCRLDCLDSLSNFTIF